MKRWLALFVLACASFVSASAGADETCEAGFQCLKPVTIYGRPPKPIVVIELPRKSAATAAHDAHETMRAEWNAQLVPATLRGQ